MRDWPQGRGEMVERVRAHDWAATSLGAIEAWPQSLRTAVDIMLGCGHAMQLAWGPNRTILYNDAYAPMLGERHPAALGLPFHEAWPEIWSEIERLVALVFAGETMRYSDMPLTMTRHGYPEETWWTFSYSPVRDESGAVAGLLNVTVDATSKVRADRAEGALRVSEERQTFLLNLSDELRSLTDPVEIQEIAARSLGEHVDADRTYYAVVKGDYEVAVIEREFMRGDAPSVVGSHAFSSFGSTFEAYRHGRTMVIEDVESPDAVPATDLPSFRALSIRALVSAPLFKRGRTVASLTVLKACPYRWTSHEVSLVQEVAERTWAAVERARAETALRASDRHKDEFLAVLAHELRNGLAPLVYAAQIGKASLNDPAMLRKLYEVNERQLKHLGRLVDDLLDVARISTGKIELEPGRVTIREVVNLAIEASRSEIDRKHHRLTVTDESDPHLAVLGDRVRLTQVVANLLSNASKYMDDGGSIRVRIARDAGDAVVEIGDTGIGIPPEALDRVFELFAQVHNKQAYTTGGLGIGLSLVRRLVEMHGGRVAVASDGLGRGSTFTVSLPMKPEDNAEEPAPTEASDVGKALDILIVDDIPTVADLLADVLSRSGHRTVVAYGGAPAIESVRQRRPDLVLLDLGMPGMDGFEVAHRLRQEFPDKPPMHIVALSGWGQEIDREKTRAASFDGHLVKPPRDEELLQVLSAAGGSQP